MAETKIALEMSDELREVFADLRKDVAVGVAALVARVEALEAAVARAGHPVK